MTAERLAAAQAAIAEREGEVRAFVELLDAPSLDAPPEGPLHGATLAVKDNLDVAGAPTLAGFAGFADRSPATADATAVARLSRAGAIVIGKTVTTELAFRAPGPTRNPRDLARTPGGSSSGSAAAVAAGMADLALGTQTQGSVIRPASFCGVLGLKPTYGAAPTAGLVQQAPSLDTIGVFSRTLDLLAAATEALLDRSLPVAEASPRLAAVRTPVWNRASPAAQAAFERAVETLDAPFVDGASPLDAGVWDEIAELNALEAAQTLGPLRDAHPGAMRPETLRLIADGEACAEAGVNLGAAQNRLRDRRAEAAEWWSLSGAPDILLSLAATGAAPIGFADTGDAAFAAPWTYLGCPSLSLPALSDDGAPLGLQLAAAPGREDLVLDAARDVSARLGVRL